MQVPVTIVSSATVLPPTNFSPICSFSELRALCKEEAALSLIAQAREIGILPTNHEMLLQEVRKDFQEGMCYGRVHAFFIEVQRSILCANACFKCAVEQMDVHEVCLFQILINVYAKAHIEKNKRDNELCDYQKKYQQAERRISHLQRLREYNSTFYQRSYNNLEQELFKKEVLCKVFYEALQIDETEQNRQRFIEAVQSTLVIKKTMETVCQKYTQQHSVIEELFRKCTNEMHLYGHSIEVSEHVKIPFVTFCQKVTSFVQEYFSKKANVTCIHQEMVEQSCLTDETIYALFENNSASALVEVSIFFLQGPGHSIGLTMVPKFSLYDCNYEIELFFSKKELIDGFICYLKQCRAVSFVNFSFYKSNHLSQSKHLPQSIMQPDTAPVS